VFTAQLDTKFAVLDIADVLGWANAIYKSGSEVISSYMPCHAHKNLKLSIEFNLPALVSPTATQINQPYIIFDEVDNMQVAESFKVGSMVGEWTDLELEEVYLGNATSSKTFLNSFYGKTLGTLHVLPLSGVAGADNVPLAPTTGLTTSTGADKLNVLLNQAPLLQQGGIDSPGKRCAFLQMSVGDLSIPLGADRVITNSPDKATSADATNSIYEGPANAGAYNCQSNFFSQGTLSYSALPIQAKVNSLQLDFASSVNSVQSLLCFGEVLKTETFDNAGKPVIGYV
jgi:hypothetical protein